MIIKKNFELKSTKIWNDFLMTVSYNQSKIEILFLTKENFFILRFLSLKLIKNS